MEIKRILVSRTDKIGDLVLSIPSFYMLKKMYPKAELIVLVREYNYDIIFNLPYIDRAIKIDDYTKSELLDKIGYFKADVFIALYSDSYIASLAKASKAKIRIGPLSKLSSFFVYNKGLIQKRSFSKKNEGEYNLDLVRKLNPELFDKSYELNTDLVLTNENRNIANLYFRKNYIVGKTLVVNPFIGGSAKNLRDDEYVQILKRVINEFNERLSIIITCYITEYERALNLKELIGDKNIYVFANSSSILNVASIIEKSNAYFGASTGPTHIAGALKKRIVAIYPNKKTQHPKRWGILNNPMVSYIIPDKNNRNENYKNPYFDKYTKEIENEIVNEILGALK